MKLDKRELATVLAALRAWQDFPRPHTAPFAPFFEDAEPLTRDEIEALCQRLNTEPDADPDSDEDEEPADHTGEVYRVYYQIKRERTPRFADFPEDSEADTYTEDQLIADILFDHSEQLPLSVEPEQVKIISREWLSQHEADHEFER